MEQSKDAYIELAEKLAPMKQEYIDVMIGYWERQRQSLISELQAAEAELARFKGMRGQNEQN